MKYLFLLLCACLASGLPAQTTSLQGRIMLNDSVAAAYATIYLPDYGVGGISGNDGRYLLSEVPIGSVKVEYSTIGYATLTERLELPEANHPYAHDVRLIEQPIVLSEVYLTPTGEDPASYILEQVSRKAKENRKRLLDYRAEVRGSIQARDLDFIPAIAPKAMMFSLHAALRLLGFNNIFNHIFDNPSVDASYSFVQTRQKGKMSNTPLQVFADQPKMTNKARSELAKMVCEDLFDILYSDQHSWSPKRQKKNGWKLKGIVEEENQSVAVLQRVMLYNDSTTESETLYVIEDIWAIKRYEQQSMLGKHHIECRNMGGGIYLPISLVTNPVPFDLRARWEQVKQEEMDENGKLPDSKLFKRADAVFSGSRDYLPYAAFPYTVRYSNCVIKQ